MLASALACGYPLEASAKDIKVGSVVSATGPASLLGDPQKRTLEMLVDEVNSKGGVNGNKLSLVIYDDGGDANAARTFATRLAEQDNVAVVIGGSTTGTSMAMAPVFEDAEIPFMSFAGAIQLIQPVKKWVFKTPHTDLMACEKIFADIRARNLTKVALLSGTDGFGKSMRDQCVAAAPKQGITIVHEETFGPRDADMTPQITNIKNKAGVEAVIVPGIGQGPAIAVRNYKQLAVTYPLYVSHGVASKEFVSLAGEGAEGARLPAAALLLGSKLADNDRQRPVVLDYTTLFEKKAGQPVSGFGGFAYDGFYIIVNALKRAPSLKAADIRDEIEKTKDFVGVGGVYNLSPKDHMGLDLTGFRMVEIRKGDWAAVP
ncbi:ABC transporter substrate-binding protein [Bosea sp. F3-2]|uniref:ABC transporter substrate-binding protein n=1 Tax=Bosea sp. F3-2 TaxID=2599640 RepID=UPI0020BD5B04|nr:ABC transporter substrate-binding protein [Bosea sp. F3-2]